MRRFSSLSVGPVGLAATAALALGLTATSPALLGTAHAAEKAGSAFVANGTLNIVGTNHDDVVALEGDATEARVTFGGDPATTQHFNLADFTTISVSLGNGDDQFAEQGGVLTGKPVTIAGGNGNDVITTGDAVDVVDGGNGDDRVDAGKGNDSVTLDNGNDFFVWNPGEGSDAVDGGNGNADVMQFNGAAADETMSLSGNGTRAVFLRNVGTGTIQMDMNDIEILNVAALGGKDSITVNDVTGTSIRQANIDLSGPGGGADGAADLVTVSGTNEADRVDVNTQGGAIDVAGLQAETRITGSATNDQLQVNTADGNDRVNVDPNISTIIGVAVDLGLGQL